MKINRRNFLKGGAATVAISALGVPKLPAKVEWFTYEAGNEVWNQTATWDFYYHHDWIPMPSKTAMEELADAYFTRSSRVPEKSEQSEQSIERINKAS